MIKSETCRVQDTSEYLSECLPAVGCSRLEHGRDVWAGKDIWRHRHMQLLKLMIYSVKGTQSGSVSWGCDLCSHRTPHSEGPPYLASYSVVTVFKFPLIFFNMRK